MAETRRSSDLSGCLSIVFIGGLCLWFVFGEPSTTVANMFWRYEKAPWETVTAVYYEDVHSAFSQREFSLAGLASIQACRDYAEQMAAKRPPGDAREWGYLCFMGEPRFEYGMRIYRTNAR